MINLAIVDDDGPKRIYNGLAAAKDKVQVKWKTPINSDESARLWEVYCANEAPPELAIILDLGLQAGTPEGALGWSSAISRQVDETAGLSTPIFDGVHAALVAMKSPRIRKLLIMYASGLGDKAQGAWPTIERLASQENSVGKTKIKLTGASFGRTLSDPHDAASIIAQLESDWTKSFPSWHADDQINRMISAWLAGPACANDTFDHNEIQDNEEGLYDLIETMFGWRILKNLEGLKAIFLSSAPRALTSDSAYRRAMTKRNCEPLLTTVLGKSFVCGPNEIRFPCAPALPFLASLRELITEMDREKSTRGDMFPPNPTITFSQKNDGSYEFVLPLALGIGEALREKYNVKVMTNSFSGVSGAINNVLRAKVNLRKNAATKDEKVLLSVFDGATQFATQHIFDDKIVFYWPR